MVVLVAPAILTCQQFLVGEIQIQNYIKSATRDALNLMTYTAAAGSYLTWTATETRGVARIFYMGGRFLTTMIITVAWIIYIFRLI